MAEASSNPCSALVDQHIAANRGEAAALKYGEKRYTFNDLAALTNRAGNVFRDLGLGLDDGIAILVHPSPAYFAAILGAMKIGAVPVLTESSTGATDVQAIVVDEQRAGDINPSAGAIVLVVAEDGGPHQSFVALLRAGTSSLIAVPRVDTASALEFASSDGKRQAISCAGLAQTGERAEHPLMAQLAVLGRGEAIQIDHAD